MTLRLVIFYQSDYNFTISCQQKFKPAHTYNTPPFFLVIVDMSLQPTNRIFTCALDPSVIINYHTHQLSIIFKYVQVSVFKNLRNKHPFLLFSLFFYNIPSGIMYAPCFNVLTCILSSMQSGLCSHPSTKTLLAKVINAFHIAKAKLHFSVLILFD